MTNSKIKSLLATSLLLASFTVRAENLMDILGLAQRNDPTLKAAEFDHQAALEAEPQSLSAYLPQITANGSYGQLSQDVLSTTFGGGGTGVGTHFGRNRNLAVNLQQTVFNMQTILQRRLAKINVKKADVAWERSQQDFLIRVTDRYFKVLAAVDGLEFARAEKNAIARQLEQAKQRFEVGLIAITDVHEAQARHDLSIAQEITAENQLATSREALREITGELNKNLLTLAPETPLVPPTPTNIDEWTKAAEEHNLGLIIARRNVDATENNIQQQKSMRYPTFNATGSYGYFDSSGLFGYTQRQGEVALNMNVLLYQGGYITSAVRQARFQAESAKQNKVQLEREVLRQTRDAYLNVLAGISHVKALKQALISSESALKATEAGFEVGTRTSVEVLDAQRELFRARRDYAQSRYDYILNTLRLKQAVGGLVPADLQQVNNWLQ